VIENSPERIDVARGADLAVLSQCLLGRHVRRCAGNDLRMLLFGAEPLRQAKVADPRSAKAIEEDICRL